MLCMRMINRWRAIRESIWLGPKMRTTINRMRARKENFLEALQDEKRYWRSRGEIVTDGLRVGR